MPAHLPRTLHWPSRMGGLHCARFFPVVEIAGALSWNPACDESFQRSQRSLILGRHEADGVADRLSAAGAADAVDVILRMHREVEVHHV